MTLTTAGKVLVRHAATVLTAMEETTAALAAVRSEPTGRIRIGAHAAAVRTVLPGALLRLGRDHPGLELSVSEWDPVALPNALRDHRVDIGLSYDFDIASAWTDPALESVSLMTESVYLAVAADGPISTLAAARDAEWILGSTGTLSLEVASSVCRDAGFTPRMRHRADDVIAVLALVAAGHGVAIVPQLAADAPTPGIRLIPVPARLHTRIRYRRGASAHPSVVAVVAALQKATHALSG
ncbi:LysR substrate-binding domain-containing protein [Actinoplanes sp. NPDC049316]|uniref:LysR substrate-binding domain-containing protein n=1 Tax=Actinoplanes sp. NPDC049316 TaxID=3154727 RepID=UPI003414323F